MIDYKYNENHALEEIKSYIDSTYTQHYSGKYQATDMIIDAGHGTGFCIGNIIKYAKRYGKKDGYNKKDLLKIIHYAIIQLYVHNQDKESSKPINLSPSSESNFAIDYTKLNKLTGTISANSGMTYLSGMLMKCYKNNSLKNTSDKCYSCDCWKTKRGDINE